MIVKSYEILKNPSSFIKYNSFLFYGENVGIKKEIKHLIRKLLKNNNKDLEELSLYSEDIITNNENFYNTLYSGSLFNSKRLVVINEASDKLFDIIEDISNNFPENIYIIIFANVLEKKSKLRNFFEKNLKFACIPCYPDNYRDLEFITISEFKKENISISRESINLIIEKSNSDRQNLRNEINKIKSYAVNKKTLNIEEVKSLINFSGEYKSDDLVNECLSGNIPQYKKILSELYTNTINQVFILRILNNKIQRLCNIKEVEKNYSNVENLLNESKPPIFWKEKPVIKKQLTIWSLGELKEISKEINNIEILCKKNPQISKLVFFNFFTKICKQASNYS